MSYWRKKSRLKLLGTALVLALLSLSLASAQQPLPTASWGLSFQQEGKPPVGNASPQALDRCDAKFLGDTSEQVIYLTFDAGFEAGYTPKLLDILKAHDVPAAFFVVGNYLETRPDLVKRMAEEGHQVGNHTWSHQRLDSVLPDAAAQEVARTDAALEALLGEGEYWLRPPYGQVAEGADFDVPMVKWSVDPRDWESRDTGKVTQAILDCVKPNSILLLHDIYPTSVEAALRVVDRLQEEGYWFVTVEELLWLNGVTPEPGRMYRTGRG